MKILRFIKGRISAFRQNSLKKQMAADSSIDAKIEHADWPGSLAKPTEFYARCFAFFHRELPSEIKSHRNYFTREGRGFGEDAFHAMWFFLFRKFKPKTFLEIGIYRGQTISLCSLLARHFQQPCEIHGISPFTSAGDGVSKYMEINYYEDTRRNFAHFGLPEPHLLKAYSNDPVAADLIRSKMWNAIYIDGNHDYEIAKSDWELCAQHLSPEGFIVLDDSGLTSSFKPPIFATAGHPGPSRVAQEIDRTKFVEILQVGHNRVFQKIK